MFSRLLILVVEFLLEASVAVHPQLSSTSAINGPMNDAYTHTHTGPLVYASIVRWTFLWSRVEEPEESSVLLAPSRSPDLCSGYCLTAAASFTILY